MYVCIDCTYSNTADLATFTYADFLFDFCMIILRIFKAFGFNLIVT